MADNKYIAQRWSLAELLHEHKDAQIAEAFGKIESSLRALEAARPKLSPDISAADLNAVLDRLEDFSEAAHRLSGYAHLKFSEDTQDLKALALMGQVDQMLAEAKTRILFFELWWKALDEASSQRLIKVAGDRRYFLEMERMFKPHTLSEPEEKVISLKDVNGTNALVTVYDIITNKFIFTLTVNGETRELTRDALSIYMRHPSPDVREAAYRELYRVIENESTVLGQIYTHRVRDWRLENMGMRKFDSPIAVRNLSNNISDAVIETLLKVCVEESGVFRNYFRFKAELLNLKGPLRRFDIYAPLGQKAERSIPYAEAADMVLSGFDRFSTDMGRLARRVLDQGHMDAENRPNKRGGAFCYSVSPKLTPWVLMNYTSEPRQVATMAHELGHAVHSMLAEGHSILTFNSALPLAETASVFSEMLLLDTLLENEKDPAIKRDLVTAAIDDIYATVIRQAFFVLFERDAHQLSAEGKTIEQLCEHYARNLSLQFGDAVEVDNVFRYEWLGIPHIYHTPFYCYAYSFGMLLSLSLYQQYKESRSKEFADRFMKILSYGGSASPDHILSEAGIDMTDAEFWRKGFRAIEAMIKRLR